MIASCRFISTSEISTPKQTYHKLKVYEYISIVIHDLFIKKEHFDNLVACEFGDYIDIDFGFSLSQHKLYVMSVFPVKLIQKEV